MEVTMSILSSTEYFYLEGSLIFHCRSVKNNLTEPKL